MTLETLSQEEFYKKYKLESSTPMMKQYLEIKFHHQDCFVLFRMGDFYELFFDDAILASRILGIALAKRGKLDEEDVPMCGVPHHALENYLPKLVESGLKVAICDQLETPEEAKKDRGYKAVVKRDVIRIITPGTIVEDVVLEAIKPNYLAAISVSNSKIQDISICYADITTGFIKVTTINPLEISSELARISPKEILICESYYKNEAIKSELAAFDLKLVFQPEQCFEKKRCVSHIESHYSLKSAESLGSLSDSQIASIGSLIQYINITQKANAPKLEYPIFETTNDFMLLDPSTRRSLELTESTYGKKEGSLLSVIDKTVTVAGSRLLYNMLLSPLCSYDAILSRQKLTNFFSLNYDLASEVRLILENSYDLERALGKILMRRCCPFDLLVIKNSLSKAYLLKELIYKRFGINDLPAELKTIHHDLSFDCGLLDLITDSVKENAPNNMTDGGFINPLFHPKLQELQGLIDNSKNFVDELKAKYQKLTSIDNLKINHNNVIGMFVEVASRNADRMPLNIFIHRQSTSTTHRFTTKELQELESNMVNANSISVALEYEIFENICNKIEEQTEDIRKLAKTLSALDVFSSFAILAKENNYTKPEICNSTELTIVEGRHPVVESHLKLKQEHFAPNNTSLNDNERIVLLTGPNMGGKSTYLRQNAIIVIMAQIGCYVPASFCKIGVVDRIFSRVGSGDDLSGGKSTFMVEMIETSAILAQSTDKSLVILDEVGRGTATFDGMAIAWAILEHLHDKIRCRSLFATHYHELTELAHNHLALKNYSVAIEERDERIIFTHKVISGSADKSYGIHVAELAGLPKSVINRSKDLLKLFEKKNSNKETIKMRQQIQENDIFTLADSRDKYKDKYDELLTKIKSYKLDDIAPREAHSILSELQSHE